jgi:hypothetical protein
MNNLYKDNRKWRKDRPQEHKSFGEKRNRDLTKLSTWDLVEEINQIEKKRKPHKGFIRKSL